MQQYETLAKELLKEHGLHDWTFVWNNAKRRAGVCRYRLKQIGLSKVVNAIRTPNMIKNTLLHEIAHALTPRQNHNHIWQSKAIEIGCDGNRCYSDVKVEGKWKGTCPNGHNISRHREPKYKNNSSCSKCSNIFDRRYLIIWSKN